MTQSHRPTILSQLTDDITELSANIDAATCRLMDLLFEFDELGGWDDAGARNCVEWLGWRLGWSNNTASEHLRVARELQSLPILHAAFAGGRVSYSKLRAVTRVAEPGTDDHWLEMALNSTAVQCEKIVRQFRRVNESENLVHENARTDQRWLKMYHDDMGMLVIEARLPPGAGAAVEKAIEAAMEDLRGENAASASSASSAAAASSPAAATSPSPTGEPPTTSSQRHADALVQVAGKSLRGDSGSPVRCADRYQVVVHVDAEVLANPNVDGRCELEHGPSLSAESLRRLTCDCSKVTMIHNADGDILDLGRKTRVISTALRRAMNERDQGCRFPGCNCRVVDAHHIEHWLDLGETELGNLISTCRRHHSLLHERGFQVRIDEAGEAVFTSPNGAEIPKSITPPPLRGDPVDSITRWNREAGQLIDADTNLPEWDGETPQYAYIVEVTTELTESRRMKSP